MSKGDTPRPVNRRKWEEGWKKFEAGKTKKPEPTTENPATDWKWVDSPPGGEVADDGCTKK